MALFAAPSNKPSSWPITIGAEGIAAAQFARCGFDVLVQAARDKPWYDLVVTKAGNLVKVAVKASEDGRWPLAQPYQRAGSMSSKISESYRAIDLWLDIHGSRTVYCLVQFADVALDQLPRIYLATPLEISHRMRECAERLGEPTLCEKYEWTSQQTGYCCAETLPSDWRFSLQRIQELLLPDAGQANPRAPIRKNQMTIEIRAKLPGTAADMPGQVVLSA